MNSNFGISTAKLPCTLTLIVVNPESICEETCCSISALSAEDIIPTKGILTALGNRAPSDFSIAVLMHVAANGFSYAPICRADLISFRELT